MPSVTVQRIRASAIEEPSVAGEKVGKQEGVD